MTRITFRPIAFVAAAALVSTLWFQTVTIPAGYAAPATIAAAV